MEEDTWDSLIWDDLIKEIKSQKTYAEARAIINRAVNELDKRFELIKPEYCSLTSKRIKPTPLMISGGKFSKFKRLGLAADDKKGLRKVYGLK